MRSLTSLLYQSCRARIHVPPQNQSWFALWCSRQEFASADAPSLSSRTAGSLWRGFWQTSEVEPLVQVRGCWYCIVLLVHEIYQSETASIVCVILSPNDVSSYEPVSTAVLYAKCVQHDCFLEQNLLERVRHCSQTL